MMLQMRKLSKITYSFKPIIENNSNILILGSFPSINSFKNSFYYAHKQNQFWKILSNIYNKKIETKQEKIILLREKYIALWDIVESCQRKNSSDANLTDIEINDIEALLKNYKNIKAIFFTSKTAEKLYKKHFGHLDIKTDYLPSPSPAYARMSFEEKVKVYKEKFF